MSKGKLAKFAEMKTFKNVLQPPFEEVLKKNFRLKGKWNSDFFRNENKITLELGCGKGEYTVGLAKLFPNRNFIGIDIKGDRIWKGAREATDNNIANVGFIRTRIDFINSFFKKNEVEEIWIIFPDPQLKKPLKRLTSSRFLNYYKSLVVEGAWLNLKTDSAELYNYTRLLAEYNNFEIDIAIDDVYNSEYTHDKILSIKTFYEKGWLNNGLRSHYIRFRINNDKQIKEPPE